jgi:hypothetical protein
MILSYASGPGLLQLGYSVTRQTGSRLCLTTCEYGEHHLTIPLPSPLHIGTLSAILYDVSTHFKVSRTQLLENLFG